MPDDCASPRRDDSCHGEGLYDLLQWRGLYVLVALPGSAHIMDAQLNIDGGTCAIGNHTRVLLMFPAALLPDDISQADAVDNSRAGDLLPLDNRDNSMVVVVYVA